MEVLAFVQTTDEQTRIKALYTSKTAVFIHSFYLFFSFFTVAMVRLFSSPPSMNQYRT